MKKQLLSRDRKIKIAFQVAGSISGALMFILGCISLFNPYFIGMTVVCGGLFIAFLINLRTFMVIRYIKENLCKVRRKR